MRQALPSNLLHNPFHNRFNDPVTHRRDDMQAYENVIWLRDRIGGAYSDSSSSKTSNANASQSSRIAGIFAILFALLLIVLLSASVLLKAF